MTKHKSQSDPVPNPLNRKGPVWTSIGLLLVAGIVGVLVFRAFNPAANTDVPDKPAALDHPRHLILISIDTLRADHLGCYGHGAAQTPVIDKLALEGALFERHYTCYPLTLPSHLTQLTGVSSLGHRVRDNLYHSLPEQIATLPEQLAKSGFSTGAFVSAFTMRSGSGIERGFGIYDDEGVHSPPLGKLTIPERPAHATLKRAGDWMEKHKSDSRLFCFVHLFDPHAPYDPPADMAAKFQGKPHAGYDAEIAGTDRELGKFFERLRSLELFENALIVITADHGEGLGEHNELSHGYFCYDSTTHIPLIMRAPGSIKPAIRPGALTRNYDLTPTLLDLLQVKDADLARQAHGQSLRLVLEEPGKDLGLACYIESQYAFLNANWAKIRALRTRESLTLFSGDLVEHYRDSDQKQNDAATRAAEVSRDRDEIVRLLSSLRPPRSGKGKPGKGGALGSPYPGEAATEQDFEPELITDTRELPVPANSSSLLLRYQQAELAYDEQRFETCAESLRELIAENPGFLMAHKLLSGVNQQRVKTEWRQVGLARSKDLTLEAAVSLATGARLSLKSGNLENATRMRVNAALLIVWLSDQKLWDEQMGKEPWPNEDANVTWLNFLLRYRVADSSQREAVSIEARKWLVEAKLSEGVRAEARRTSAAMERQEVLLLAPWE